MQFKKSYFIDFLILFLFISQTGCVLNENKKPVSGKQSNISALLDSELNYLEAQKNNLKINQRIIIKGQSEEKTQDVETVKKALQTLKEMDIDRMMINTSFQKTGQNLINSKKSPVLEENFILKEGEKSPIKRITIYYNNTNKKAGNIIGFFILKRSVNKLFTSRQSHYLKFKDQHLQYIEMKGLQKIIFSAPIDFKSVIEIKN